MSSGVFARVQALNEKAAELLDKGHLLRAAENFGLAAETARPLREDNFVSLQFSGGNAKRWVYTSLRGYTSQLRMPPQSRKSLRCTATHTSRSFPAWFRRCSAGARRARC